MPSLPLGAIVLLSDGADNSGGIDLQTIAAIRRQRLPIHTIGFGREHPDKDVEVTDAVVAARALPQSKLSAVVSLQSYGLSGNKARLSVRDNGVGFDAAAKHKGGIGLLSMKERVRLVDGEFTLKSKPGRGTRIDVWAALPKGPA